MQPQTGSGGVYGDKAPWRTGRLPRENRLERLHGGDDVAISREIVVLQIAHLREPGCARGSRSAELDDGDFLEESSQRIDPITAATALAPGIQQVGAVKIVRRDRRLAGRAAFHDDFDPPFALMRIPYSVIEAELDLLLHAAGKLVRGHPTGVNIEGGFAAIGVRINDLKLHRIPSRRISRTDQPTLTRSLHSRQ